MIMTHNEIQRWWYINPIASSTTWTWVEWRTSFFLSPFPRFIRITCYNCSISFQKSFGWQTVVLIGADYQKKKKTLTHPAGGHKLRQTHIKGNDVFFVYSPAGDIKRSECLFRTYNLHWMILERANDDCLVFNRWTQIVKIDDVSAVKRNRIDSSQNHKHKLHGETVKLCLHFLWCASFLGGR